MIYDIICQFIIVHRHEPEPFTRRIGWRGPFLTLRHSGECGNPEPQAPKLAKILPILRHAQMERGPPPLTVVEGQGRGR
jgi:hypothetical protein